VTDGESGDERVEHHNCFQVAVCLNEGGIEYFEVDESECRTESSDGVGSEGPDVVDETIYEGKDEEK